MIVLLGESSRVVVELMMKGYFAKFTVAMINHLTANDHRSRRRKQLVY